MSNSDRIRKVASIALFCALAYVCTLIFRMHVGFLTFDIKDSVITVGALFFGPLSGVIIALVAALLELTVSDTGIYGFIMNFVSSAVFAAVPSLVYKYRKRLLFAIIGLLLGVVTTASVMMVMNIWITPFFMAAPRSAVIDMIPTLLLPFNLVKGFFNASIVLVLYKPFTNAMYRAGLFRKKDKMNGYVHGYFSILITVIGVLLIAACALYFVFEMDGTFEHVFSGR